MARCRKNMGTAGRLVRRVIDDLEPVTEYKGYTGIMELGEEAGVIFGRVLGLRDVVTFQGDTVAEARQAFRDSVDDYLEFCAERGESPEKPPPTWPGCGPIVDPPRTSS